MKIEQKPRLVTVFGGSGFVGRHLVRALANRGYRVRVAVRRPDLAFHLQPLGNVGQIRAVQANLRYPWSVARAVEGSDCVVNLVAIARETSRQKFSAVQEYGAGAVAEAAASAGTRLVHVSAIGADEHSPSAYARTKAAGEQVVRERMRNAIIMRPSIIFGSEDQFFNRFAAMAGLSPVIPLIGAETRFQPVYVTDVAEAIARAVDGSIPAGRTYELGGPEVATFRECMELMLQVIDRKRLVVNIPASIAGGLAKLTGWMPGAPVTHDQVLLLSQDNVVSQEAIRAGRTLAGMGITPHSMASILPSYLVRFRPSGQFTRKGSI
ncbi:MAG: complex I NDUFA9 subunit family protein [Rhizobiaceae bacterium]